MLVKTNAGLINPATIIKYYCHFCRRNHRTADSKVGQEHLDRALIVGTNVFWLFGKQ